MFLFKNALGNSTGVNVYKCLLNSYRQTLQLYSPCAGAKTFEQRIGLPPKPKKPLTPYFRFMKEVRPSVLTENPGIKLLDVVKIVAHKWSLLDEEAKKKFQEDFKKDQRVYVEQRAKYDSKLSPEQKIELRQLKQEKVEAKEKRETRKRVKELGRPKRPPTAYLKFLMDERKSSPQGSNQTYKEWSMKMVEKWARMSDEVKETYLEESKKNFEKHKQELSKWEEKMVRLGHIDVVRNQSLIDPPPAKPRKKSIKAE